MPPRGPSTPPTSRRRVLVNDRPLLGPRTGVGQYLAGVLGAWPESLPRPVGVLERLTGGRATRLTPCPLGVGGLDGLPRLTLTPLSGLRVRTDSRVSIARAARRSAYAAAATVALRAMRARDTTLWQPNHHPLLAQREGSPVVTTIHDLSVLQRPGFHPPDRVRAWERALPRTLARTSTFIAVSHATARAIETDLGVPSERVRSIPLSSRFAPAPESWTKSACREALGLDPERPLVVHLGTIEPRKNLGVLLEAQRISRESRGDARTPDLLLVGGPGWGDAAFWRSLTTHPEAARTRCTGYVSDAASLALLVAADVVVCPSWLEGFGLPALEAMGAGTPVVVSSDPALREATGGIAPVVEPGDAAGWAREIARTIEDGAHRSGLVTAGRALAARRTWHDVAHEHAAVFAE